MICYSCLFQNFPQFVEIHTVKGFSVVNETEVDVLLELSCFFYDPMDVGNLISGSSAFSKSNLNTWKFLVHLLLKPSLDNFVYYFASDIKKVIVYCHNWKEFHLWLRLELGLFQFHSIWLIQI